MRRAYLLLGLLAISARAETPEEFEARLRDSEAALARIRSEESSIIAALEALEAEIRAATEAAENAERQAAEAEEALLPLEAEETRARDAFRAHLEALRPRLLSRYRLLRRGSSLAAEDPSELLRNAHAMDRILAADLEALREARRAQRRAEAARARLEEARQGALALADAARDRLAEAEAARALQRSTLQGIRQEKRLQKRLDDELREAKRRLDRELARLARARSKSSFARRHGALRRPTAGIVEVPFGRVVNAKFGTVTHHNGIDIRAPQGSEVVAVEKGRVAYAAWFRGYGNLVILDHGEGYHTLYGHLEKIAVEPGAEVEAGQPLGTVGETGSLKGPFLYFELREDGKPVDPLPWFGR